MLPKNTGAVIDGQAYMLCCGKLVCGGCYLENVRVFEESNEKKAFLKRPPLEMSCPFCRWPIPTSHEEALALVEKRMQVDDAHAFVAMASYNRDGLFGLTKDESKRHRLLLRAAELGSAEAHFELASSFENDEKKYRNCLEFAAKKGHTGARSKLGLLEYREGKIALSFKHWRTAAAAGYEPSLNAVKLGYKRGHVRKDEFAETLRAYQRALDEEKSKERDKFAAERDKTMQAYMK